MTYPGYFSRITLDEKKAGALGAFILENIKDPYRQHRLIWDLFSDSPERERDFLFHCDVDRKGRPLFHTVSARPPEDRRALFNIETKDYAPSLKEGMTFTFSLRANPTVKKEGKRHDVVMNALPPTGNERMACDRHRIASEEGGKWLERKGDVHGFSLLPETLFVESYEERFFRDNRGNKVTFHTLDFRGQLKVTDSALFQDTLFQGIGRAKSYGCGLLMIRRG